MTDKKLREMRDWAQAMSYSQREPRWTWQRYKDLVAMIDGILASQAATIVMEKAKRADLHTVHDGPRGENVVSLDLARRDPPAFSMRLAM